MSKMDSYMQGRTEGMEFALRLVKDKGIEELEKEIKFRQRTGISLNVTRQELNAASNTWQCIRSRERYPSAIWIQSDGI